MSEMDDLRRAMREKPAPSPREVRAARTRAEALSPVRIIFSLLGLPLVAGAVAISIYVRTSPYKPPDALMHLVARAGCDAARYVGMAPAFRGGIGYHAKNDADGDGVVCETVGFEMEPAREVAYGTPAPKQDNAVRTMNGAKFVRP